MFHRLLTAKTPFGRKAREGAATKATPLIRVKPKDLDKAGVMRVGRVASVRDGLPALGDGSVLDVANVIWCSGYRTDFPWIDRPIFEEDGKPRHERGVVTQEPGLYFIGLPFLYAMSSAMIQGVGRDARHVVDRITERLMRL